MQLLKKIIFQLFAGALLFGCVSSTGRVVEYAEAQHQEEPEVIEAPPEEVYMGLSEQEKQINHATQESLKIALTIMAELGDSFILIRATSEKDSILTEKAKMWYSNTRVLMDLLPDKEDKIQTELKDFQNFLIMIHNLIHLKSSPEKEQNETAEIIAKLIDYKKRISASITELTVPGEHEILVRFSENQLLILEIAICLTEAYFLDNWNVQAFRTDELAAQYNSNLSALQKVIQRMSNGKTMLEEDFKSYMNTVSEVFSMQLTGRLVDDRFMLKRSIRLREALVEKYDILLEEWRAELW